MTYPDGRVVGIHYDSLNRLSSVNYNAWGSAVQAGTPAYWTAASYAAPGLLQTVNYGNGVQMQAGYNSRLSLSSLSYQTTSPAAAQTFFSKTYLWDSNGMNLLKESNLTNAQQRQFGYDKLNRLTSAVDYSTAQSQSTATATLAGTEGTHTICSSGAVAAATITPNYQPPPPPVCHTYSDGGTVSITVGSFAASASYGAGSTTSSMATALASALSASGSPVTATANGASIALKSIASGATTNYSLSSTGGDFTVSFSGLTMTGGNTGGTVPGGVNQQYSLDNWGNLSSMGNSGFNQTVNAQNQIVGYSYDAAGRLLSDSLTSYTYDDDGMLVSSSDGTTYVYDASNQRAQIARSGSAKEYYYFAGQLLATQNPALGANGWTDYIYAGGQKIATVAGTSGSLPTYTLPDHLGSEVATTNSSEGSASALDYSPFGQILSGTSTDPFVFTSLERDTSGLDHAGFRMYSSGTGRWTTPDPYDGSYSLGRPQTFNRYAYVGNQPLGYKDPKGLFGEEIYTLFVYATEIDVDSGLNPVVDLLTGAAFLGDLGLDLVLGDLLKPQFHGNVRAEREGKQTRTGNRANQIFQCASKLANKYSIAGVLNVDEEVHPVLAAFSNAFLGNTFSGISDSITHIATGHLGAAYGDFALGGTMQGLPGASTASEKGIAGVVTEVGVNVVTQPGSVLSGVTGVATELGEEGLAGPVGLAKLGIDGAVYLSALAYCRAHP